MLAVRCKRMAAPTTAERHERVIRRAGVAGIACVLILVPLLIWGLVLGAGAPEGRLAVWIGAGCRLCIAGALISVAICLTAALLARYRSGHHEQ